RPRLLPHPRQRHLHVLFFFSRRRRHTTWPRDWSSDVCSSDLYVGEDTNKRLLYLVAVSRKLSDPISAVILSQSGAGKSGISEVRSEERRVGKECNCHWRSSHSVQERRHRDDVACGAGAVLDRR